MPNPGRTRLALVEPVYADPSAYTEPVEDYSSPAHWIPFCIRLTAERVLEVADDVDIRAQMLAWSTEGIPNRGRALGKVSRLREVAIDLRKIAADLAVGWDESDDRSDDTARPSADKRGTLIDR